jgi:hypothetical protein
MTYAREEFSEATPAMEPTIDNQQSTIGRRQARESFDESPRRLVTAEACGAPNRRAQNRGRTD